MAWNCIVIDSVTVSIDLLTPVYGDGSGLWGFEDFIRGLEDIESTLSWNAVPFAKINEKSCSSRGISLPERKRRQPLRIWICRRSRSAIESSTKCSVDLQTSITFDGRVLAEH